MRLGAGQPVGRVRGMPRVLGGSLDPHEHGGRWGHLAAQVCAQARRAGTHEPRELAVRQARAFDRLVDPGDHPGSIRPLGVGTSTLEGHSEQRAHTVGLAVRDVALDPTGHVSPGGSAELDEDRTPVRDQASVHHGHEPLVEPRAHIIGG